MDRNKKNLWGVFFFEYTEMDKIQKRRTCVLYFHFHDHFLIVAPKTILNIWPTVAVSFEVTGRMIAVMSLHYNRTDALMDCTGFVCTSVFRTDTS
jgi:hypothetical protein